MYKYYNYRFILVVDDEPDVESLIRQRFRKSKYNFLFSHNGEHALNSLSSNKNIDLVISDINMPVMDGLTLLGELKNEHPLVKAIIVSAYDDMTNIREAMNKGAFDFITKLPTVSYYLKKAAKIKKGNSTPGRSLVGKVTSSDIEKIAKEKMQDLNAVDLKGAINMVKGSAGSMGMEVAG